MKLINISLINYRQFFGENTLKFSVDPKQNITVIHGENGAGKTSILNAFKWCFYGEVDFDTGTENLLNEQSIVEAKTNDIIHCGISVKFSHEDTTYVAIRRQSYKKFENSIVDKMGASDFSLEWIDKNSGEKKISNNPEIHINQILPKSLHSYFFFNGERIEKLASASSSEDIRHAIKSIMGLQVIERGKKHLDDYVINSFRKEMKSLAGDSEYTKAMEHEEKIDEQLKNKKNELENFNKTQEQLNKAIKDIGVRLEDIKESAQLQKRRDEIESRISTIKLELDENKTALSLEISKKGFLGFFNKTADSVQKILDEKREKGELPYKIRAQFIDDLLEEGFCICGTDISPETEAAANLRRYKSKASSKSMEDAFIELSGALKHLGNRRESLFNSLRNLQNNRVKLEDERHKLIGELDTISNDVGVIEHASELEEKRKKLDSDRDQTVESIGKLKSDIKLIEEQLKDAKNKTKKISESQQEKSIVKKRLDMAEESSVVLGKLLETLSDNIKIKLSEKVNNIFKKIIRKDYWAEIDDKYTLQIFKNIPVSGKQVVTEKSTGESQITSLSFISCIVNLAKENEEKKSGLAQGGIFPIVMDSPFGALDDEYRTLIARYVPELAEQIIVFVSSSQWKGCVEHECKGSVGLHHSLVYFSPKLEGEETKYLKRSDSFERTEIMDGYYDR